MLADLSFKQNFLTPSECQEIIDYGNTLEFQRGKWGNPVPEVNLLRKINSVAKISKDDEIMLPFIKRIDEYVKSLNDNLFNLDIDYNCEENQIRFIKMDGAEKAFVSNHQKVNWLSVKKHRKIYASILLSDSTDFEGGEFLFNGTQSQQPSIHERRKKGNIIVMPCFRYSEITPVLSGMRHSLVLYYYGNLWK